jgi:CheY-like chemotaxis protein
MAVASILVCEADPDVRRLLIVLMKRLGHETFVLDRSVGVPPRGEVLILEPAAPACVEAARQARLFDPELPIVSMGMLPDGVELDGPIAYLEKPFTVEALAAAVAVFTPSPV